MPNTNRDVRIYCLNAFRYLTGEEPLQVTGRITKPNDPRFREVEAVCTSLQVAIPAEPE